MSLPKGKRVKNPLKRCIFPGVLRCLMVSRQILVLLPVHASYVSVIRVHARPTAIAQHGRNPKNGQQTI